LALKSGKPVVGLGSFDLDGMVRAGSPAEAVEAAFGERS
jgi:hypothetical protein